jgi:hypothetical protein
MPECRCRTEAAGYRKNCRCRTNFSTTFRHLHMIFQGHITRITPSAAVYGRAGCITSHYTYLQFGRALGIPFTTNNHRFFKCRTVRHPVSPVLEWTKISMPEPARYTGRRGPSPVQECSGTGQRHRMPECRCPAMHFTYPML